MRREDVLTSARLAGSVVRYHTWPTTQKQTVADHTFHVLRIYLQIWGLPPPEVTANILTHDLGEIVTGDMPFPFKARNPDIHNTLDVAEAEALSGMGMRVFQRVLTDRERARIKACDLVEMYEFGLMEISMGNAFGEPIVRDIYTALEKLVMGPLDSNLVFMYMAIARRGLLNYARDPREEREASTSGGDSVSAAERDNGKDARGGRSSVAPSRHDRL